MTKMMFPEMKELTILGTKSEERHSSEFRDL